MSDYKVAIMDMASSNEDLSYVTLKEIPYMSQRSPSAATTISKINVTCSVLVT